MISEEKPRKRRTGPGKPFQKGDPRICPLPTGRKALTESEKMFRSVKRRAVEDLRVEMKSYADKAVDFLVATLDNQEATVSERLTAAREILDRGFGKAAQQVVADISVSESFVCLTPDMLRQAALRIAAVGADDAQMTDGS
jgi:hypothetical protein